MIQIKNYKKINNCDLLAIGFFILLVAWLSYCIRFGFGKMDETLYVAFARRFALGDRPLIDEWHVTQFIGYVDLLPYVLFRKIVGSNDGIMLFMRQVFVVVNALFYLVIYVKLRHYRYGGWVIATIAAVFIPHAIFALNYYNMTFYYLMLLFLVLFIDNPTSPGKPISSIKLVLSGILLSLEVLLQPPLALLYVLYSITVLIIWLVKKKKAEFAERYAFILNIRCWVIITASVLACAIIFLGFLQVKSGLKNIIDNLPQLLNDPFYNVFDLKSLFLSFISRIKILFSVFGVVPCIIYALFCLIVLVLKQEHRQQFKSVLFLLSCVFFVSCFVISILLGIFDSNKGIGDGSYFTVLPMPMFAFGLVNYLLCEEKNPRLQLFLIAGTLASIIADFFSTETFGTYGVFVAVPGFLCAFRIREELLESQRKKIRKSSRKEPKKYRLINRKSAARIIHGAFALFVILIGFNLVYIGSSLLMEPASCEVSESPHSIFSPYDFQTIESGPYKGIKTTKKICNNVYAYQEDLDRVKDKTGIVYLDRPNPLAFMYLDMQTSNCFSWPSLTSISRQFRFFESHPEKRPDYIYFCYDFGLNDELDNQSRIYAQMVSQLVEKLSAEKICQAEVIQGSRGLILKINHWNNDSYASIYKWAEKTVTDYAETYGIRR